MTGVKVYIANVSKLGMDGLKSKGKNHLIINIGYAFGKQGYDIIKCFSMLFGSSISSFAFIGKAGGLIGNRKEILLASKFFNMITKDITTVNPKGINSEDLEKLGLVVHKGGMLTVPGTILQNQKVLNYYKHIESCVGLEMEGCFYAQAVQEGIDMSLINSKVPTRFLYYVSDLPLDPNSNLAQEGENVSWDEGVPTMNAITSLCLKLCGKRNDGEGNDRVTNFIMEHEKFAFVQKYWDVAQEILNMGVPVIAFVSVKEELPKLTGNFVTLDYIKDYDFLIKVEEIASAFEDDEKVAYAIFEYPDDRKFVHSRHVSLREMIRKRTIYFPKTNIRLLHHRAKLAIGCKSGQDVAVDDACLYFEKNDSGYWKRVNSLEISITSKEIARELLS
jgi:hypothetical protein